MQENKLIEHETVNGFFRHPEFLNTYVSRNGLVFNSDAQQMYRQSLSSGYLYINTLRRAVHLLVLDTFSNVPVHLKDGKVIGNHINGITTDNKASNLEWTSYSGNSEHAYRTGLRQDNVPVLIKDLRTGEVVRHYSLWEAARVHETNGGSIHWFLKPENSGKVFKKYFIVIREGSPWPIVDQSAINPRGAGHTRQVYVEDYKHNVRIVFPTIVQAAEHLEIQMATLYARIRAAMSKGLMGYVDINFGAWYLDVYTKELAADVKVSTNRNKKLRGPRAVRKPIPIIVTDLATGEKETVASSEVFARRMGVKKNTFQKHVYSNEGVWKGMYHVRYVSNASPAAL